MVRVGIINVTGYAGMELARILLRHPLVELTSVTGRSLAGQRLAAAFPHLAPSDLIIGEEPGDAEVVFSALPHKASAEVVAPLVREGRRVIDLSADFRLHDREVYERWYKTEHPAPDLLASAVYGLPEAHRDAIRDASLVASPGCYPTSALLGLLPAVRAGLIEPDIIVDSKSGVSGAGRSLSLTTLFSEINDNLHAYALDGHRHQPEIGQELAGVGAPGARLTFIPHLVPMTRGILSTCYAPLTRAASRDEVRAIYEEAYHDEPFALVTEGPPQTKQTSGTNRCLVFPVVDEAAGRLVVVSCLDNLVKGAAGQAVQAMNLMCGFPETCGLDALALYP